MTADSKSKTIDYQRGETSNCLVDWVILKTSNCMIMPMNLDKGFIWTQNLSNEDILPSLRTYIFIT